MKKSITLASLVDLPVSTERYPLEAVVAARKALVRKGLKFCNVTGKICDNSGVIEEYTRPSEFVPHTSEDDVMRWEFQRHINNTAFRILNGFAA